MSDVFRTVLCLSLSGSAAVVILSGVKLFLGKYISAAAWYVMWIMALCCMVVPFWKAAPLREAKESKVYIIEKIEDRENVSTPVKDFGAEVHAKFQWKRIPEYIWKAGMVIYYATSVGSYLLFLIRKRLSSSEVGSNEAFENMKRRMNIGRKIRLRRTGEGEPPMLTGIFHPTVYVPGKLSEAEQKMVFRHELTHYKHKDLVLKWAALIIGGVHWFNPLMYVLAENISQSCEIRCDKAVTARMNRDEKIFYMETILNTAEKGRRRFK